MNIIFFGDIVGQNGIDALASVLPKIKKDFDVDFAIANGENASKGKGLTESDCKKIFNAGVDVITLGNHYRSKDQIDSYIEDYDGLIRPLNLIDYSKGFGSAVFSCNDVDIRITNILGQGLMREEVKSPFDEFTKLINNCDEKIHIVDFHGESTSEKKCFGFYFDGKVSAVLGTHTHVQTNDAQILPSGTGFISDVGMCGSYNSIIGFEPTSVISKIVLKNDGKFSINAGDKQQVNFVVLSIDDETGECLDIQKYVYLDGVAVYG